MINSMSMKLSFPGGVAVEAHFKGHTVRTDQPRPAGGEDSAMSPFDLFLASMATCMGFYALRFCQQREIPTDGLGLSLDTEKNAETKHIDKIRVELTLPEGFPEKYRDAILRAVDQCAVKRHIFEPPEFEIELV
jgi:ribosomal protein S12 methylthiotransferase accessory factor